MKTKYNNLLNRYSKAIEFLYDKINSGDYTADAMTYDYEGYLSCVGEDQDIEDLKQAVQKAELLIKYYKHNYKHYKYC